RRRHAGVGVEAQLEFAVRAAAGDRGRLAAGVVQAQLELAVGIGFALAGGLRLRGRALVEAQLELDLLAAAAPPQGDAAVGRVAQADTALAARTGQLAEGDLVLVRDGGGGGGHFVAAGLDR